MSRWPPDQGQAARHREKFDQNQQHAAWTDLLIPRPRGDRPMKAHDVMVSPVITVKAHATVKEVAVILLKHHISALPVVDNAGKLIGIVSEGDLMRRADLGTERQRSWWLAALFADEATLAAEYVKAH